MRLQIGRALVMALAALIACSRDKESAPAPSSSGVPSAIVSAAAGASATPSHDGTDPKAPVLSPDDANFVDTRSGGGWGDRCFNEIKQGKLGWAHAACDRGLALPDVDEKVRPLLLYNEGLIAKHAGDNAAAKNYFTQSLVRRSPTDPGRAAVEKELVSVGGNVPAATGLPPIEPFIGKAIAEQMSFAKVKEPYTEFATLYHADIDNDGHLDFVLCEKNPVGLHNDWISGVYIASPSSGVMIDSTIPVPNEGPFGQGVTYFGSPFLRNDPEGVTMTLLEGPANRPARYMWKGGHIRRLDGG
jgi:hypothetical protein